MYKEEAKLDVKKKLIKQQNKPQDENSLDNLINTLIYKDAYENRRTRISDLQIKISRYDLSYSC